MAKPLLTNELWQRIEPHIPPEPPKPKGGRPPIPNRACLTGILFVLKTGTPWEYLPQEMGCGSGMTCWRRLRDWQITGVWQEIWQALLDELGIAASTRIWGQNSRRPLPPMVATARGQVAQLVKSVTSLVSPPS